jgi:hypothetical protein
MRKRPWASLRLVTALAVTLSAAVIGVASAHSASAITACGTHRALLGPWFAMENNSHRNLAWTQPSGQSAGARVSLKSYTGSDNQCWRILGGFGGGRIEIENFLGTELCLSANQASPRANGVAMQMEQCLSRTNQMFVVLRTNQYQLVSNSALCIGLNSPVGAGAVVYQFNCNNSSPGQHWFVDNNP